MPRFKAGDSNFNGELLFGLHGDSMNFKPFFVGEMNVEGSSNEGVSLSIGVEVTLLFRLELVTSDKTLADLDRSILGRLLDRFSGDPVLVPGSDAVVS